MIVGIKGQNHGTYLGGAEWQPFLTHGQVSPTP